MKREVEIRFAVSMVGGTSLAIHMNGTSQELYKMCQADNEDESPYGVALSLMMADRAMVDVLSGTSAGGINAILLSAALANGSDLEITESVFEQMGDIDLLLRPTNSKNPPSILQGDEVILNELENVFRKLLSSGNRPVAKWPLELFVTGTHLQGLPQVFRDSTDSPIHTLDYRGVFRFQQPAIWDKRNPRGDFREHKNKDFDIATASKRLARAGRTTSSLPAVFEPSEVLLSEFEVKEGPAILDVPSGVEVCWMGDGGYLNVRPLDLILQAVTRRASSGAKVIRKLVLVEPAPDPAREFDNKLWPEKGPGALEHLKLYSKISSSQSLKNVLAEVARHNNQAGLVQDHLNDARAQASSETFEQSIAPRDSGEPLYEKIRFLQAKELMPVRPIAKSQTAESMADTSYDGVYRELLNLERWSLLAIDECYSTIDLATKFIDIKGQLAGLYDLHNRAYDARYELGRLGPEPTTKQLEEVLSKAARILRRREGSLLTIKDVKTRQKAAGRVFHRAIKLFDCSFEDREELSNLPAVVRKLQGGDASQALQYLQKLDQKLLPLEFAGGLKNRNKLDLVIIDPSVRVEISNLGADLKLAGDQLSKFGGFLKRSWRLNDILWGRLDGAAKLLDALLDNERIGMIWGARVDAEVQLRFWNCLGISWSGENFEALDHFGAHILKTSQAKIQKAQAWLDAPAENELTPARELLTLRRQLAILEEKMPGLIAGEMVEAAEWGNPSGGRAAVRAVFPKSPVDITFSSSGVRQAAKLQLRYLLKPQHPLDPDCLSNLRDIHSNMAIGSQGLKDIPLSISVKRLSQALLVGQKALEPGINNRLLSSFSGRLSPFKLILRIVHFIAGALADNAASRGFAHAVLLTLVLGFGGLALAGFGTPILPAIALVSYIGWVYRDHLDPGWASVALIILIVSGKLWIPPDPTAADVLLRSLVFSLPLVIGALAWDESQPRSKDDTKSEDDTRSKAFDKWPRTLSTLLVGALALYLSSLGPRHGFLALEFFGSEGDPGFSSLLWDTRTVSQLVNAIAFSFLLIPLYILWGFVGAKWVRRRTGVLGFHGVRLVVFGLIFGGVLDALGNVLMLSALQKSPEFDLPLAWLFEGTARLLGSPAKYVPWLTWIKFCVIWPGILCGLASTIGLLERSSLWVNGVYVYESPEAAHKALRQLLAKTPPFKNDSLYALAVKCGNSLYVDTGNSESESIRFYKNQFVLSACVLEYQGEKAPKAAEIKVVWKPELWPRQEESARQVRAYHLPLTLPNGEIENILLVFRDNGTGKGYHLCLVSGRDLGGYQPDTLNKETLKVLQEHVGKVHVPFDNTLYHLAIFKALQSMTWTEKELSAGPASSGATG